MIIVMEMPSPERMAFIEQVTNYLNSIAQNRAIETRFSPGEVLCLYEQFNWSCLYTEIAHSPQTPLLPKFIISLDYGGRFGLSNLRIEFDPYLFKRLGLYMREAA